LHLVGLLQPRITMHGATNIKFVRDLLNKKINSHIFKPLYYL